MQCQIKSLTPLILYKVMAQNKKRTQYVTELVNNTNDYLRFRKVKDTTDTLFAFMCDYLLKKVVSTEAGSYKEDEFDYLQIY